ncbi:MAG: winged helix-turn-helix domain-containing protein [Candidatus Thermoplasmatota archaeon]|nr:winged helix-turn-helix domain-containing protein [Candidatus Thermoplasmatota archaeon]
MKDEKRRKILIALKSKKNGLSFKEIEIITGISPTALAYHLKIMKGKGIIEKEFRNLSGRRDYSFYSISKEGRKIEAAADMTFRSGHIAVDLANEHPDRLLIIPSRLGPRCISITNTGGC